MFKEKLLKKFSVSTGLICDLHFRLNPVSEVDITQVRNVLIHVIAHFNKMLFLLLLFYTLY